MAQGMAQGIVEMCREFGLSLEQAADALAKKTGVTQDEAMSQVRQIW